MIFPFFFPLCRSHLVAGPEETKNVAGKSSRLIQIRLSDAEFGKNLGSSSRRFSANANHRFKFHNAVNLSSARATKRFPSPRCASAIQIVHPPRNNATNCEGLGLHGDFP